MIFLCSIEDSIHLCNQTHQHIAARSPMPVFSRDRSPPHVSCLSRIAGHGRNQLPRHNGSRRGGRLFLARSVCSRDSPVQTSPTLSKGFLEEGAFSLKTPVCAHDLDLVWLQTHLSSESQVYQSCCHFWDQPFGALPAIVNVLGE